MPSQHSEPHVHPSCVLPSPCATFHDFNSSLHSCSMTASVSSAVCAEGLVTHAHRAMVSAMSITLMSGARPLSGQNHPFLSSINEPTHPF